jgi:DNA mismatch repair protein MutL
MVGRDVAFNPARCVVIPPSQRCWAAVAAIIHTEVCMSIHILPQEIANAIAAGEVVERPVSVVKELVENAIDANASRIDITIEGGGLRLIEVYDDGCGIPAPDIPLALSRFATSKLSTLDDLFAVRTLGFRGEALASIASVSHFELSSQAAGAKVGSRLRAEGSELGEVEAVASPQGTTVSVRDLFFNVPARLKFMKTEETEKRRIVTLVTRYAMAYPAIRFGLRSEGRELVATPGNGDGRDAVAQIYGWETARQLLTLPAQPGSPVDVSGFISPPSVHRSSRRDLILFVNGRWVQDATIATAVVQAYHGLLMVGRYPLAILFIQLDPTAVDVNVHPAKAEVRFREPDRVFAMVQRTVRATLLGHAPAPAFDPGSQVAGFPNSGTGPAWVALGAVTGVPDLAQMPLAGTSGR